MIRDHTFNPRGSSTGICHEFVFSSRIVFGGHRCGRTAEDHQTIDELETILQSFLQYIRKEYKLARMDMVETWDGENETYSPRLIETSATDSEIIESYVRRKSLENNCVSDL